MENLKNRNGSSHSSFDKRLRGTGETSTHIQINGYGSTERDMFPIGGYESNVHDTEPNGKSELVSMIGDFGPFNKRVDYSSLDFSSRNQCCDGCCNQHYPEITFTNFEKDKEVVALKDPNNLK
jgi:hypothetical protein